MTSIFPFDVSQLLAVFVAQSSDGYAIYDENDVLVYANQNYAEMFFNSAPELLLGKTFDKAVEEVFHRKQGIKIDSLMVAEWLKHTHEKRWQQKYRSFEIELRDGRWLLASEQVIGSKFLFTRCTEITRTKQLEHKLRQTQARLYRQAYNDELTRVPNRRAFFERCAEEINKAHRNNSSLTLYLVDLDYFKQINDKFGHLAGDSVLQDLATLVHSQLRDYDFFARIGGEEFALLFTDGQLSDIQAKVEQLRQSIETSAFEFYQQKIQCSASFGGTQLRPEEDLEQFFARADQNLYRAKSDGRNQVVFDLTALPGGKQSIR